MICARGKWYWLRQWCRRSIISYIGILQSFRRIGYLEVHTTYLEVHTTKISWRGLLTVVWASKYYKKGSKYYKKGEGIKRYTSTPPNIVVEHTPQVSIFGGVVVVP